MAILRNRIGISAVVLIVIGISITAYSYTIHPVYYTEWNQSATLTPSSNTSSFSQLPQYPLNITMSVGIGNTRSINYKIYEVSEYERNGVTCVTYSIFNESVLNGILYLNISPHPYPVNYEVQVNGNGSYKISFSALTVFPTRETSDLFLEIPGIAIIISGAIIFAVFLTRISKKI